MNRSSAMTTQMAIVAVVAVMVVAGRQAKAVLTERAELAKGSHPRPLAPGDHARFVESWHRVQAQLADGPGGTVSDADRLLRHIMSIRGYPVSNFELRAADISVAHPQVLEHYRAGHQSAFRQTRGLAAAKELREAMIHYRTLFEYLVGEPEAA